MIKKVRIRFTLIGMAATLAVTVLLITAINLFNSVRVDENLARVLTEMSREPEGEMPKEPRDDRREFRNTPQGQYAGRFFFADIREGEVAFDRVNTEILSEEELQSLIDEILAGGRSSGYRDGFRYLVSEMADHVKISFLDCTLELQAKTNLLLISSAVGFAGLILSFLLIFLASGRIVAPLKESMEKQKRFITDAGHELKTPLSVIGTNMDILSMDLGENEWVDGTKKQVHRLRNLVNHLISLAKLDEGTAPVELKPFDVSSAAMESADAFASLAAAGGREIRQEIEEQLCAVGDESMIRQLFTIFCDNAVKYAVGEDPVLVRLYKAKRKVVFETANQWDRENRPEDLNRFFDRFYRADVSRNRNTGSGGYGLGLSIARELAEKNNITLQILEDKEQRFVMRAVMNAGQI